MTVLIDAALRSSVVLLAGLGARAALRKRSAALRHVVLAGAIGTSAAVVPLSLVLPSWIVSMPRAMETAPTADIRLQSAHSSSTTLSGTTPTRDRGTREPEITARITTPMAVRLWCGGVLAFAIVLAAGMLRLARVVSRASIVTDGRWRRAVDGVRSGHGLQRDVRLLQTDTPDMLATCGIFRPRVLLPSHASEWSDDRIHVVLCHELAHVRRFDWPIQIGAEAVRTVLWFNPLAWLACVYLRRDSEQACDDLVLERGVAAHDYATHLLELARTSRQFPHVPLPALPIARRSTLERRISDMLNPRLDRRPVSIRILTGACALLVAVLLPTSMLRAAQTGPALLTGTVYDTTGGVMPGAAIALEDATQMKYTATTDVTGRFAFSNVPPGHYTLEASLAGFKSLRQEFDLNASRDWDRAITLQVGTIRETITVSERRNAAAAPAPATTAAGRIRVGGSVRAPMKLHDVRPLYPASMREAGREGVVPIDATIGADGTVTSVRILTADVHPDFALAAADAVRQWRFTPTLLNGSPVEVVMTVSVRFTLSDQ